MKRNETNEKKLEFSKYFQLKFQTINCIQI